MGKLGLPVAAYLPPEVVETGVYKVELKGFKPKPSSDRRSINLNPTLRLTKPDGTETPLYNSLNFQETTGFIIAAFCRCFGKDVDEKGDIPGEFIGIQEAMASMANPVDPTTGNFDDSLWGNVKYQGPLLNATGEVRIVKKQSMKKQGSVYIKEQNSDGTPVWRNEVDCWINAVPEFTGKTPDNLARN